MPASFIEGPREAQMPWDICVCGDFRADHEDDVGSCKFGSHHIPRHRCDRFQFSHRSDRDRAAYFAALSMVFCDDVDEEPLPVRPSGS